MLLKASQWGLVGALFLGSLLPSECFPEAGNNQAANVSLNVKIHVGHSSTGTQNHAIIPATNQKIGNQRNAFGRRGAGNQLDVMPIARKVMRNQNGALPMGRLAPKHYQNIMPRVRSFSAGA